MISIVMATITPASIATRTLNLGHAVYNTTWYCFTGSPCILLWYSVVLLSTAVLVCVCATAEHSSSHVTVQSQIACTSICTAISLR